LSAESAGIERPSAAARASACRRLIDILVARDTSSLIFSSLSAIRSNLLEKFGRSADANPRCFRLGRI
jgi:hypothetical protein